MIHGLARFLRGWLAVVTAGALVLAPLRFAHASPEQARANYARGVELVEQGDLPGARSAFESAYLESPHYLVLHNLARVSFDLGDLPAAHAYLTRYLHDGATYLSAEQRTEAETFLADIEARQRERSEPAVAQFETDVRAAEVASPLRNPTDKVPSVSSSEQNRGGEQPAPVPSGRDSNPATRQRSTALALGGAGLAALVTGVALAIWNHARYVDWQDERARLGEAPPPSQVTTQQDLASVSAYERSVGSSDATFDAIQRVDIFAWATAAAGTVLLGTGVALYVSAPTSQTRKAYAVGVSGRF